MSRGKKFVFYTAFLLLLSVFAFSAWKLISYYRDGHETQSRYEELAGMVESEQYATSPTESTQPPITPATSAQTPADTATEPEPAPEMLSAYQSVYEINPHLVGWIEIEGTVINYPVVQTPDDPDYYLYRDFYGKNNAQGCIFADGACNVENSDNVTIYGHHMNNGTMFAPLMRYTSESFLKQHPTIRFDSLTQNRNYQIFAVFRTSANVGEGFAYHTFVDASDEAEFDAFISQCKALSIHDTGITPEYGDQIICLSTCEYSEQNGRLVVAAVLIDK